MQKQEYVNPFKARQLEEYGEDGLKYLQDSQLLAKYVARKGTASQTTAESVRSRLNRFGYFAFKNYPAAQTFDAFLAEVKGGKHDPYNLLSEYAEYLTEKGTKANQIRQLVKAAKQFMKHRIVGAAIDNDDFRENVSLPRQEFPDFEGTEKSQVVELLQSCDNQRLKTALMLFAAMGPRAIEGCAVRHTDINYENETITFRAKFAKMRRERTRPMPKELKSQLQLWEKIKYQPHYVTSGEKRTYVTPQPKPEDLVLAYWHPEKEPKPSGIYDSIYHEYRDLANMIKMERKNGRRVITFHRLRAFAKTVIENQGYPAYAEWWIGHGRDTYYRNSKAESQKIFEKVEPYLTFLDVTAMESKGADQQSQIDELQAEIRRLKEEKVLQKEGQEEYAWYVEHKDEIERLLEKERAS